MDQVEKAESVGVKHEYTDLTVEEISIVDRPANLKEFAVIKCVKDTETETEEPTMADEVKKSSNEATEVVEVPVDVAKSDDGEAMGQVIQQLEELQKSVNDLTADEEGENEKSEEAEESETETEKAKKKTPRQIFKKALEESGVKGEALKAAMEKYEKECGSSVKKSEEKDTKDGENDFMGQLSEAITKAKTLTPKRLAALKELQNQFSKLMADMESIPHSGSPNTKAPSNTSFGTTGLKPIMKQLEGLTGVVKSLVNKVEKIERTKQPSKSLGDEDVVVTSKKSEGNFWSGVI